MIEELSTSDKHSHRTTRSGGTGEGKDKGKDKDSVYSNSDSGKKTKTKCECECAGESESQIQSQSEIGEIMKRIKAEQVSPSSTLGSYTIWTGELVSANKPPASFTSFSSYMRVSKCRASEMRVKLQN